MSQLSDECKQLIACGIQPEAVVEMAQKLGLTALLRTAFPTMPSSILSQIMHNTHSVGLMSEGMTSKGESFVWKIIPHPTTPLEY